MSKSRAEEMSKGAARKKETKAGPGPTEEESKRQKKKKKYKQCKIGNGFRAHFFLL
jgi:hypothetical protein